MERETLPYVLILGNCQDAHANHLHLKLTEAGFPTEFLETALFPTKVRVSWEPATKSGYLTLPSAKRLPFQAIRSVFWRTFTSAKIPKLPYAQDGHLAFNDAMSTLRTFMQGTSIRWVNSWQAYQFHKEKPLQLRAVEQLGVQIPKTLIGNDPIAIREFAQNHSKVIFKPVYGGAHTKSLEPKHLALERLELALQLSPIALQEYIPGTNLRVYVIGNALYAAEIRSAAIDFRSDQEAHIVPLEIPDKIQQQSHQIARALGLTWTAIDWRLTPEGKFVFLEANPSPMFIHFERQTQYPITQALINVLTQEHLTVAGWRAKSQNPVLS
ncbi:MAG: hypothetical protein AAGE59_27215 [Cyanobacteria bacterium P01_F01_bin.86]